MNLKKIIKQSFLEISRYQKITFLMCLNLVLGLIGFFLLQIFQQSLQTHSLQNAKASLGGDISINARRSFSETERQQWESLFKYEKSTQFYSLLTMMSVNGESRLVSVGVFDSNYPLYGTFKISDDVIFTDKKSMVWIDPEIQEQFDLNSSSEIQLGEEKFKFAGSIVEDPTRLFRGVGFAPRVLIHQKYLHQANLLQQGSTFTEYWTYKVAPSENIKEVVEKLSKVITDTSVRIESYVSSGQDSNRVLSYFTDYLGLVALVALGLCFLSNAYLFRWLFLQKKKTIAIYKVLGISDLQITLIQLIQIFCLSLFSFCIAYVVISLGLPSLNLFLAKQYDFPIKITMTLQSAFITFLLSTLGSIFIVIPDLLVILKINAKALLQGQESESGKTDLSYVVWSAIAILLFWFLSIYLSNSIRSGSYFVLAVLAIIAIFSAINELIFRFIERCSQLFSWKAKYAFLSLVRRKSGATLVFTTLSIALLMMSLLPHIKSSILSEIKPDSVNKIPKLFLFDIQSDQVADLEKMAQETLKEPLTFTPLVRSRIIKINDQDYERELSDDTFKTREDVEEARFRNRGVNLTYRVHLQDSESLYEGKFEDHFNAPDSDIPKISLERRYADRIKAKIGDKMTFDVQGLPVEGIVSSIRNVRWTSFQPNFFILFPNGVLEDAPQFFLSSVNVADLALAKKFQNQVTAKFKNISSVDVTATVESSIKYIDQMSMALQFMAGLSIFVGFLVFIILVNTQISERLSEMNLLQILGTSLTKVRLILIIQFAVLLMLSLFFGILMGLVVAWGFVTQFFNLDTVFDFNSIYLLLFFTIPTLAVTMYIALRPLGRLAPVDLIRQEGR